MFWVGSILVRWLCDDKNFLKDSLSLGGGYSYRQRKVNSLKTTALLFWIYKEMGRGM